jgi:hypothetical protein
LHKDSGDEVEKVVVGVEGHGVNFTEFNVMMMRVH